MLLNLKQMPFSFTDTVMKKLKRPSLSDALANVLPMVLMLFVALVSCKKKQEIKVVSIPVITLVDTTIVKIGDTLRLTGTGFKEEKAANIVSIGSIPLTVLTATSTQITAKVPDGVNTGQLTVSFAGGKAVAYSRPIRVVVDGQPVINSISPAGPASPGDTLFLRGINFESPARNNSVKINGAYATIITASDSLLVVTVPTNASTGNVLVTTNVTSLPYPLTIVIPNVLQDGRLYWAYLKSTTPLLIKGNDPNGNTILFQGLQPNDFSLSLYGNGTFSIPTSNSVAGGYSKSSTTFDKAGNLYTMNALNLATTNYTFSLVKTSFTSSNPQRQVLWTWRSYLRSEFNKGITPTRGIFLDGNQLYIQNSLGFNFLSADISKPNPVFTPVTFANTDISRSMAFSANNLFYANETALPQTSGSVLSYAARSTLAKAAKDGSGANYYNLPGSTDPSTSTTWTILQVFADASHGDSALMLATRSIPELNGRFSDGLFLYDPVTDKISTLYDRSNWPDADWISATSPVGGVQKNTGFLWVNGSIYYANGWRDPVSTQLLRLNSDGSSKRPIVIYSRMESGGSDPKSLYNFLLFIDKTQAVHK